MGVEMGRDANDVCLHGEEGVWRRMWKRNAQAKPARKCKRSAEVRRRARKARKRGAQAERASGRNRECQRAHTVQQRAHTRSSESASGARAESASGARVERERSTSGTRLEWLGGVRTAYGSKNYMLLLR